MAYEGRYSRKGDKQSGQDKDVERSAIGRFLDDHVRLIAAVLTVAILLAAFFVADHFLNPATTYEENEDFDGETMSLGTVYGLSLKGKTLSWDDLKGYTYETLSESEDDSGVYAMRKYPISGGDLSLTVGGYIGGDGYTGVASYAKVFSLDDLRFEFSLFSGEDLYTYMESRGFDPDAMQ